MPATPFVATFIGTPPANLLRVHERDGRYWYKQINLGPAEGSNVQSTQWFMYRAESLKLATRPGKRSQFVSFIEATPIAGRAIVTVSDEGKRFNVIAEDMTSVSLDDRLYLEFPPTPEAIYEDERQPSQGAATPK